MSDVIKKINECLTLQDYFNTQVNSRWRYAGYPFYRAAWMEIAEAVGPTNWKWWKEQKEDRQQLLLEFVDTFHFLISDVMIRGGSAEDINSAYSAADRMTKKVSDMEYKFSKVELLMEELITRRVNMKSFWEVVIVFGFTIDDVLNMYLPKNTLNIFRQKNGYKEGTYIKIWNGKEDNKVLEEILENTQEIGYDQIYQQLEAVYATVNVKSVTKKAK
jgi:dimeric dUTPase (all-alpha-NTP-PPase superfamily)